MGYGSRDMKWACLVSLVLLTACTTAKADRDDALLKDARECEAYADAQLRAIGQEVLRIRLLFFQTCMSLHGWGSD
jgi:hypothetical protein